MVKIKPPKATFRSAEKEATVEIVSHYGDKHIYTITANGYELTVHIQHFDVNGDPASDGVAVLPIDTNTVGITPL